MRVCYVSIQDPNNISSWSGTNYFLYNTVKNITEECTLVNNLAAKHNVITKIRYKISRILKHNFLYQTLTSYCRQYAFQTDAQIPETADLVFTTNSNVVSFLRTKKPVVLYMDATFAALSGYYEFCTGLSLYAQWEAKRNEKKALNKASLLLFASEWAALSAIKKYNIPVSKTRVVPFGANIFDYPDIETLLPLIAEKNLEEPKFLFVGVEFERKGGALAIEIIEQLNRKGIRASITFLGLRHFDTKDLPAFVINGGFLRKEIPAEYKKFKEYFLDAHFFLMPAQNECYGVAFAEAASFGLPVFAIDTGGVGTVVKPGTGWLFPPEASAESYVKKIIEIRADKHKYLQTCENSLIHFQTCLNWSSVGNTLSGLFSSLVK